MLFDVLGFRHAKCGLAGVMCNLQKFDGRRATVQCPHESFEFRLVPRGKLFLVQLVDTRSAFAHDDAACRERDTRCTSQQHQP
jgi:hypothetical protein